MGKPLLRTNKLYESPVSRDQFLPVESCYSRSDDIASVRIASMTCSSSEVMSA